VLGVEAELYDVPLERDSPNDWYVGEAFDVLGLRDSHYRVVEIYDDHLVVERVAGRRPRFSRRRLWGRRALRFAVWLVATLVAFEVLPYLLACLASFAVLRVTRPQKHHQQRA
jgi:hypothetical protein